MAAQPTGPAVYCSFCGESQHDRKFVIAGPHRVYICNECVDACVQIGVAREAEGDGCDDWFKVDRPVLGNDFKAWEQVAREQAAATDRNLGLYAREVAKLNSWVRKCKDELLDASWLIQRAAGYGDPPPAEPELAAQQPKPKPPAPSSAEAVMSVTALDDGGMVIDVGLQVVRLTVSQSAWLRRALAIAVPPSAEATKDWRL